MPAAACPTAARFVGAAGLEQALARSARAVRAERLAEKLLAFALGRGVEYYDGPAIRKIMAEAKSRPLPLLAS